MSVDIGAIHFLVTALFRFEVLDPSDWRADDAGQELWNQTHAQQTYRHQTVPLSLGFTTADHLDFVGRLFKCIEHYTHQASRHDGWTGSQSAQWVNRLKMAALFENAAFYQGFQEAEWGKTS